MRGKFEFVGLVLAMGLATACAFAQMQGGSNSTKGVPMSGGVPGPDTSGVQRELAREKAAAGPLKITFGKKSAEWTPATLAALPHQTVTVFNEHAKTNQTYSGVALIDLLKPLGVPDKPHGEDLRLYLVAEGSDRYGAVYAVAEANPDVHDGTVIVADAMDGKPLTDDGPLKLIAAGDKRPARWVRNLVAIRVLTAQ
jgi:hypothetical protein